MEQGRGLYLASYKYGCGLYLDPYKRGQGSCKEKKNIKETIKMPSGATNVQLNELAKRMRVPYFKSLIFSFHVLYNTLPTNGTCRNESGIVNLDDATRPGTHLAHEAWVAYAKRNNRVYFHTDSFSNPRPPKELVRYFENDADDRIQSHVLSDVRSELLRTCLQFLQMVTRVNLKSSTSCCEILELVERFFGHVVDAYAEREEHRPRSELLSRHRFE